jgi:hypothetical protein
VAQAKEESRSSRADISDAFYDLGEALVRPK